MKSREIRTTVQFLGIPVPEQPFPNVNDTPMMQKNIRLAKRFVFNNHNVLIKKKVETCQLFPWSGFWRGWWPVLGLWLRLWLVLLLTLCSEGFCSASKCLLEWDQIDVNQTFLATVLWSMLEKAAGHYNQIIEQTKEQDLSACCTCRSTPCPAAACRSCLCLGFALRPLVQSIPAAFFIGV